MGQHDAVGIGIKLSRPIPRRVPARGTPTIRRSGPSGPCMGEEELVAALRGRRESCPLNA
jgi:hypothetical protein